MTLGAAHSIEMFGALCERILEFPKTQLLIEDAMTLKLHNSENLHI